MRSFLASACIALVLVLVLPPARAADDAAAQVQFIEEPAGNCVSRGAMQVLVKNTHPQRRLRVWLLRTLDGRPTADRSRSELAPGAEPEPLGCTRDQGLVQGWRLVRAEWAD